MFANQMQNLDELSRANHGQFVDPGNPNPRWLQHRAENAERVSLVQAELREEDRRLAAQLRQERGLFARLRLAIGRV